MTCAPRVIGPESWTEMAWRNGGGTTSEICAETRDGMLLWRLSTAIVESDGPYSVFPGLTRISTVIEGRGTKIAGTGAGDWQEIAPLAPTRIDGGRQIEGRLLGGPIRYLNLFFDPVRLSAQVTVLRLTGSAKTGNQKSAIFCVEGDCEIAASPGILLESKGLAMNVAPGTTLSGQATLVSVAVQDRADDMG